MSLTRFVPTERVESPTPALLNQLAGVTGIGWTVSMLGYLASLMGYWTSLLSRLAVGPRSLLYLGFALFVATLGLDRLQRKQTDADG